MDHSSPADIQKPRAIALSDALVQQIDREAALRNISRSAVIKIAISEYLLRLGRETQRSATN